MSWQIGAMLTLGALAALGLLLTIFRINPRDDDGDWREFNRDQTKRRAEERGRKTRAGIR